MWTSFEKFASNMLYNNVLSLGGSSISYDETTHQLNQRHLPRLKDHQIAEAQRMEIYFSRYQSAFSKKFLTYDPLDGQVSYDINTTATYPKTDANDGLSWRLKDYYPVISNDDFENADKVMYLKGKISRFIKSHFENSEYRLKKCIDYKDNVLASHEGWDKLMLGEDPYLGYKNVVSSINADFTDKTSSSLIPSQSEVDPRNLDGDGDSATEKLLGTSESSSAEEPFIIPGDPQRLIYRGLLHLRREQIGTSSTADTYMKLWGIQNPLQEEL